MKTTHTQATHMPVTTHIIAIVTTTPILQVAPTTVHTTILQAATPTVHTTIPQAATPTDHTTTPILATTIRMPAILLCLAIQMTPLMTVPMSLWSLRVLVQKFLSKFQLLLDTYSAKQHKELSQVIHQPKFQIAICTLVELLSLNALIATVMDGTEVMFKLEINSFVVKVVHSLRGLRLLLSNQLLLLVALPVLPATIHIAQAVTHIVLTAPIHIAHTTIPQAATPTAHTTIPQAATPTAHITIPQAATHTIHIAQAPTVTHTSTLTMAHTHTVPAQAPTVTHTSALTMAHTQLLTVHTVTAQAPTVTHTSTLTMAHTHMLTVHTVTAQAPTVTHTSTLTMAHTHILTVHTVTAQAAIHTMIIVHTMIPITTIVPWIIQLMIIAHGKQDTMITTTVHMLTPMVVKTTTMKNHNIQESTLAMDLPLLRLGLNLVSS